MYKQKMKNGKVQYFQSYRDPMTGKIKTASVVIKPTGKKSDDINAEKVLRSRIRGALIREGDRVPLTFKELVEMRIDWQKKHLKEQTAVNTEHYMNTIIPLIGSDVLVNNLTASFVKDRLYDPSPVRYNERIKHFKAMIRWAYREDLLDDISWLDKITRMKEPPVREKDMYKYLEKDEIPILLNGMTEERWRLLSEFQILSGLRIGESIGLNDEDVDLDRREITVNKTYALQTNKISTTKTDTSDRVVYMQDELLDCCRRMKLFIRKQQFMFGHVSPIFYPDLDGHYLSYGAYAKYLRENSERLLGRRIQIHALRHTHCAMLAEAGIDLQAISTRLGHADSRVTKKVYYHVTERMREKYNEEIRLVKIL